MESALVVMLAVLTALVYAPTLAYGWVYDDPNWLPVTQISQWQHVARFPWLVANDVGGGLPWAYHALVIGLHLFNGLWLYWLAQSFLSTPAALIALALFWLHPLQVESVAYVSGGQEVLLTAYVLVALTALSRWYWPLGLASLGAAVLLKLSALPALILIPIVALRRQPWLLFALLMLGAGVLWPQIQIWAGPSRPPGMSHLATLEDTASALCRYLAYVVWPVGFSIEHQWSHGVIALMGSLLVTVGAWCLRTIWVAPLYALIWIAGWIAPRALIAGAPPLTEHHTYLPFIALWLLIAAGVDRLSERVTL